MNKRPYNYSKIKKQCSSCGKIFLVSPANKNQKFCSAKCYGKSITGKKSPFYKGGKPKCLGCGKEISYISKRCYSCAKKGKLHPNYKDGTGRAPYSFDFNPKLKKSIRQRDGYKCKYCGMTEEEHLKKYNSVLEVHHKDHDRTNSKRNNLITACKKCNLEH
jgi:ribosomal protein L31